MLLLSRLSSELLLSEVSLSKLLFSLSFILGVLEFKGVGSTLLFLLLSGKAKTINMSIEKIIIPIINSICFGTHKYIYGKTDNHMVSGAIAGLCATPFVHLSCIGKVKRQIGLIPKLRDFIYTRGFLTSCFRELTGFGSYFYIYHTLRENNHSILLSGSFGGLANWSISYPFDVIRSRQYAYNISFMNSLKQGNLYGGYIPCALRAVIVNGTGFWVYEKCLELFTKQ